MKNKFVDAISMGVLIFTLLSLPLLAKAGFSMMFKASSNDLANPAPAFIDDTEKILKTPSKNEEKNISPKEKSALAKEYHENYENLIEAMLTLKDRGHLTSEEISNIHNHIDEFDIASSMEFPYSDKDLLEYLYDNQIITKAQYRQIIELLDEDDLLEDDDDFLDDLDLD